MSERAESPALSQLLLDVCDRPQATISVAELTDCFGGRAMGALLFLFGLGCTLPLPPGSTTIFGLPLLLIAPQLAAGARAPWLPKRVRARQLSTADLKKGLRRMAGWVRRVESVSRPRMLLLLSPFGQRAIGVVCTVLALVLILPIPLGNLLPAAAVTVLSFSLIQRDGAIALLGHLLAVASAGVLVIAAQIVVNALQHLNSLLAGA